MIAADWFSTLYGQGPFHGGYNSLLHMFIMQRIYERSADNHLVASCRKASCHSADRSYISAAS